MSAPILDVISGPTASGKSAVALELARRRWAELLSVDSMKIYKRLLIGVAKPSPAERAQVRHHLIDWKEPWESCSVGEWRDEAERIIADCAQRKGSLIAEGGTALYLKALREGLFEAPPCNAALRERLEDEAAASGVESLHRRLTQVDPAAAARILKGDLRRIVRALEVHELTGRPISEQQVQWGRLRQDLRVRLFVLILDRRALYRRIDERAERMIQGGWLDECRALLELNRERPLSREALQAIGYRTLFSHLRGEMSLPQAVERIRFDTHHFARRQLSWFRRFPGVIGIEISNNDKPVEIANRIEAAAREK